MADETEETTEEQTTTESAEQEGHRALSQEDINRLIEAARKQEKDKLYETISTLKDKVSELSDERKQEQEERRQAEERAQKQAEETRMAELSAEDRLAEQLRKFEQRLAKEQTEREKLQTELAREREVVELERHKTELLDEVTDPREREYVKDVARGESKEELQNSVARARGKYQDFFAAAVHSAEGTPGRTVQQQFGNTLPGPADGDLEEQDLEQLKGLRGLERPNMNTGHMTTRDQITKRNAGVSDDYIKNREQALDQVGALYQKVQGRG